MPPAPKPPGEQFKRLVPPSVLIGVRPPSRNNVRGECGTKGFEEFEAWMCAHEPAYAATLTEAHNIGLPEVERLKVLLFTMSAKSFALDNVCMELGAVIQAKKLMQNPPASGPTLP